MKIVQYLTYYYMQYLLFGKKYFLLCNAKK